MFEIYLSRSSSKISCSKMMFSRQIIFRLFVLGLFVLTSGKPMIPNFESMYQENLATKLTFVRKRSTESPKMTKTTPQMFETTPQPTSEMPITNFEKIPKQNSEMVLEKRSKYYAEKSPTHNGETYNKSIKTLKSSKPKNNIDSVGEILRRYVRL